MGTIHPSEAYNDEDGIKTLLDNRRCCGFFAGLTKLHMNMMTRRGLKSIKLENVKSPHNPIIFYNTGCDDKAQRLAAIATINGGYLPINTAAETHEIGILLGYDPAAVKDFIMRKFPDTNLQENTKKKLIITETQYKAIVTRLTEDKIQAKPLIKESNKEVILGAALIISRVMGKSLSNYNQVVGEKAISDPKTMAKIKDYFEDENKLEELTAQFEEAGMRDPSAILAANAMEVVDEYNKISDEKKMTVRLGVDVINNFTALNPPKD